jgi:hypothetical protein
VNIQPRTDGLYDMQIGDGMRGTYGMADIMGMIRELFDVGYREAKAANQKEFTMEEFKSRLSRQAKVEEIEAQMLADMAVAAVRGRIAMQIAEVQGVKYMIHGIPNSESAIIAAQDGTFFGVLDTKTSEVLDTPADGLPPSPTMRPLDSRQIPAGLNQYGR